MTDAERVAALREVGLDPRAIAAVLGCDEADVFGVIDGSDLTLPAPEGGGGGGGGTIERVEATDATDVALNFGSEYVVVPDDLAVLELDLAADSMVRVFARCEGYSIPSSVRVAPFCDGDFLGASIATGAGSPVTLFPNGPLDSDGGFAPPGTPMVPNPLWLQLDEGAHTVDIRIKGNGHILNRYLLAEIEPL